MDPPARASPPRRRRVPIAARIAWWTAWVGLACGVAAAIAVGLLPLHAKRMLERAAARVEQVAGPLEPTWRRPNLTPEDNASARLIAAARAVRLDDAERELIRTIGREGDPREIADRRGELAPLVERNRGAIDSLLSTSGLANDFGVDPFDPEAELPAALGAEQFTVAQLAVVDAHLSTAEGDPGRSERVAAVLGEQATRYGEVPTQLHQMLSRGYQSYQLRLVHHLARACEEPACPERLRDALPPNRSRDAFRRTVAGETELMLRRHAKTSAELRGYLDLPDRLVLAWFDYSIAGTFDQWLKLLAGWDLDPREMEAVLAFEPGPIAELDTFRSLFAPDWTLPGRLRSTSEARDLAELALTLRAEALGGVPCDRAWTDALAAWTFAELSPAEVAVEQHDDRSCTLRRAGADYIVAEIFGGTSRAPPFDWPVPPPTPPAPAHPLACPRAEGWLSGRKQRS